MTLGPLPPGFAATVRALHRVAEDVVSPARVAATGNEIALEPAPGGFGTPTFPDGGWVRVSGAELVSRDGDGDERREPLDVDPAGALALGEFYSFGQEVLRALRAETPADLDPSPIRLWPEHFDLAFELGSEAAGQRAGYGASPRDDDHDEPYVYVVPWRAQPRGRLWNATAFPGAELGYAELLAAADPIAAALAFLRERRDALLG
jgi:hypothetical protein